LALISYPASQSNPKVLTVSGFPSAFFTIAGADLPGTVVASKFQYYGITGISSGTQVTVGPNATGGTSTLMASGFDAGSIVYGTGRGENGFVANYYDARISIREIFLMSPGLITAVVKDRSYDKLSPPAPGVGTYGRTKMIGIKLTPVVNDGVAAGTQLLSSYSGDNEGFSSSDLPFGAETVFVTGVAYTDQDRDGDYTDGEGLGKLKITLSTGEWFAVTSTSGGYSIPVRPNSGTVTVTAEGFEPFTVNVGTVNVKADFIKTPPAKPVQVNVPASTGSTTLGNLSARGVADYGEAALIVGFVIEGSANKTLLVRGAGPALTSFGVSGALQRPLLTLYNSAGVALQTNTKWSEGSNAAQVAQAATSVGAFTFDSGSFDAALLVTLPPGAYSAVVRPNSGAAGVALVEAYDVSKTDGSRLINLSTRGQLSGGDGVVIVGFVVAGQGTKRLLVRGVGPTLAVFGLTTAAPDTAATLYNDKGSELVSNDDWSISSAVDQITTLSPTLGAFALVAGTKDSVILTSLPPGAYTTIISSKNSPGVGLVEVYDAR